MKENPDRIILKRMAVAVVIFSLFAWVTAALAGEPAVASGPETNGQNWLVEQMPGGTVSFSKEGIDIMDKDGCTVWFRQKLDAPVEIDYEAMVVNEGKAGERVSDLNCFWMAQDPRRAGGLLAAGNGRTGQFKTYDTLATYYVGYGGNNNSTTRFRRYAGDGKRPLFPANDLSAKAFLLKANHWYKIKLTASDGVATFSRDGELIFTYRDNAFLTAGWFGIRTVSSHLRIRNFHIKSPAP